MRRAVQKRSAYFVLLSLAAAGGVPAFGATKPKAMQAADAELHDGKYLEAEQTLVSDINSELRAGVNSIILIPLLNRLCDAYQMDRKYQDLEALQVEIIELWRRAATEDQIILARSMSDLAHTYVADGRLVDAETSWQSAIEILEREKRIMPTVLANYLRNLASLHARLGKYDMAEAEYKRALQLLGDDYPHFQKSLARDYAKAQERMKSGGDPAKAEADVAKTNAGVVHPQLVHRRAPGYTERALEAHVQGTVILQVIVDENGKPTETAVLEPLGDGLDENAVKAVHGWRFEPGTKDGRPVPVLARIEVNFHLR